LIIFFLTTNASRWGRSDAVFSIEVCGGIALTPSIAHIATVAGRILTAAGSIVVGFVCGAFARSIVVDLTSKARRQFAILSIEALRRSTSTESVCHITVAAIWRLTAVESIVVRLNSRKAFTYSLNQLTTMARWRRKWVASLSIKHR
jgi:hypothetical protein